MKGDEDSKKNTFFELTINHSTVLETIKSSKVRILEVMNIITKIQQANKKKRIILRDIAFSMLYQQCWPKIGGRGISGALFYLVLFPLKLFSLPLSRKVCKRHTEKLIVFAFHECLLCRERSLSCHTCCDTGPQFFTVSFEGPSNIVAFYENQRVPMTYSNLDPYEEGALTYKFDSKRGYNSHLTPLAESPDHALLIENQEKTCIYMQYN